MKQTILFILAVWLLGCSSTPNKSDSVLSEIKAIHKLASNGNAQAQHRLCYGYSYGQEGLEKDDAKAFRWCEIAARSGAPNSITLYAEKLYMGIGTAVNYPAALLLYEKAAIKGHMHAQYIAAMFYFKGYGTESNPKKGMYWLLKAAQQGHKPALEILEKLKPATVIKT